MLLIIISIYYYVYKADNHFKSIEIIFLLSYLAFFTRLFILISALRLLKLIIILDFYLQFLYLMIRDLDFDRQFSSIWLILRQLYCAVTLYFYLVYDLDRIIFASSATVFSNYQWLFSYLVCFQYIFLKDINSVIFF